MSISQAIENFEARYAHQPEFVQAVKEMAGASIVGFKRVADALVAYGILNYSNL